MKKQSRKLTSKGMGTKSKLNQSVKILISYHKKDALLKDNVLTPINAGRTNAEISKRQDISWLRENTIADNTGENISIKNSYYNEMTSLYWAWKNYDKLGNPDYIGHMHYRRHFHFSKNEESVYELGNIEDNYLERIGYTEQGVLKLAQSCDLIVPKPQWRASAYEHFKRNLNIAELDLAIEIMHEKYPEYREAAEQYLSGHDLYFCNIFIMPQKLFFEYCEFMFPIMEEFENRVDMTGKRMYISEWLTGIFIHNQIISGKKAVFLPTVVAQADVTIPVVFSADNNYAVQMAVAMTSLLKNAKITTHYDIHCIVPQDFTDRNEKTISKLHEQYNNCNITFNRIDDSTFDQIDIKTSHLSKGTFYRLLSAQIFPNIDKIIYLDVDIIVCGDLEILYRFAVDAHYIGGVRAPGYYHPESWRNDKQKELGLPSMDQYINAGVLLMNLKKIREDNLTKVFLELANNNYRSEDQDVINVACFDKIRFLPFRFNAQTKYTDPNSEERYKAKLVIPEDEFKDAIEKPVIIHYANKTKPWSHGSVWQAGIWLEYANISPFKHIIIDFPAYKQKAIRSLEGEINGAIKKIENMRYTPRAIPNNFNKDKDVKYKVSVIVPCYNVDDLINQSLSSILLQSATLSPIEVICIDDGSDDGTLNTLCAWAELFDNIKVLVQGNKGAGLARNMGIDVAQGKFIAFMDADDMYPSATTLENLYHTAVNNKVKIAGGCFATLHKGSVNTKYSFPLDGYTFSKREIVNYVDYQFDYGYTRFVYNTDFLRKNNLRFPDYKRYQDPVFFTKAMVAAKKFMAVPELSYKYRISHKEVVWDAGKTCDMLHAILDILQLSKRENLPKLHFYTYLRIKTPFHLSAVAEQIRSGNQQAYALYSSILRELDYEMMKKADNYDENEVQGGLYVDLITKGVPTDSSHDEKLQELNSRLTILENMSAMQIRLSRYENEMLFWKKETELIRSSWTFKFGRFFTFIPRLVRKLIKSI